MVRRPAIQASAERSATGLMLQVRVRPAFWGADEAACLQHLHVL